MNGPVDPTLCTGSTACPVTNAPSTTGTLSDGKRELFPTADVSLSIASIACIMFDCLNNRQQRAHATGSCAPAPCFRGRLRPGVLVCPPPCPLHPARPLWGCSPGRCDVQTSQGSPSPIPCVRHPALVWLGRRPAHRVPSRPRACARRTATAGAATGCAMCPHGAASVGLAGRGRTAPYRWFVPLVARLPAATALWTRMADAAQHTWIRRRVFVAQMVARWMRWGDAVHRAGWTRVACVTARVWRWTPLARAAKACYRHPEYAAWGLPWTPVACVVAATHAGRVQPRVTPAGGLAASVNSCF
jgi:hypothetical protein